MDIRSTVLGLYPRARITSMGRDPSSRLGRANPRSYHNINQAIDIAPIPGVKFDDYVGSLRKAGVNILEARDEVTNPSRHATGPHWHVAFGKQQDKPMFGSRPQTLADIRRAPTPLGLDGSDPLAPAPELPPLIDAPNMPQTLGSVLNPEAPAKPKRGGMFGSGLSFGEVLAHGLMGAAAGMGNAAPLNAYYSHKREEADRQAAREMTFEKLRLAREEAMRPRLEQVGSAIGMVDPQTGKFTPTYVDQGSQAPTSLERNIAYLKSLDPNLTDQEAAQIVRQNLLQPQYPRIITYPVGEQTVTEQVNPDGTRTPVGRAPRWQPPKAPSAGGPPPGFILD